MGLLTLSIVLFVLIVYKCVKHNCCERLAKAFGAKKSQPVLSPVTLREFDVELRNKQPDSLNEEREKAESGEGVF